ncbi:MAG: hypothetical protein ACE5KF_09315 [Kiloniellaceae bacterium]
MRRLRLLVRAVAALFGGLMLAACAGPPPKAGFPEIAFGHLPPIKLDVREVIVERAYLPPNKAPNVEHLFPVQPAEAAARWARDRLAAAGPTRRARFIVREAAVTETALKTKGGLEGALTIEQSQRYDARILVELRIVGGDGRTEGRVTVQAERSVTVPENITLSARERAWFELTEDIMTDLNGQLERTIRSVLFRYLVI